jgi:alkylhydroperoxidase family enzyme
MAPDDEKWPLKPTGVAGGPPDEVPATKIRITEDAEAEGDVAEAYDFWRKGSRRTKVPGIIKCFGARPDFLRNVIQFSNTVHFSEGHLTRRHKEMIASHVSFLNRCPY